MLQGHTLTFLSQLKANNNAAWFAANRPAYEAAKADFQQLVGQVLAGLATADPAIGRAGLDPRKCLFRINRDVRFSADKSPYKTNFAAWFNVGGKGAPTAGYYLHVEPGASLVAGGMYMPAPDVLARIRQEIDYNLHAFEALLSQPAFARQFRELSRENVLQRPPKGYEVTNPALQYLKLKSFTASQPLPDADMRRPDLAQRIGDAFASLQPLVAFLNKALS
ncbi:conserved hypothetical protein [Hymenobacter roseosalivarius DSM 11622]|uniref:TIGR02453 family protein n=1 Tax=Hymenobacter roseosalivarius DSM 11622 TaxID=645990 RepID=A0A1W1W2L4_9BACT|nr:DUF2461 domain-containing protein [Hymenobacter roseosalivarius]SMB99354.1 conserved hypothetical protein [Hymenobacter roseosalivarius DSM 11622]